MLYLEIFFTKDLDVWFVENLREDTLLNGEVPWNV